MITISNLPFSLETTSLDTALSSEGGGVESLYVGDATGGLRIVSHVMVLETFSGSFVTFDNTSPVGLLVGTSARVITSVEGTLTSINIGIPFASSYYFSGLGLTAGSSKAAPNSVFSDANPVLRVSAVGGTFSGPGRIEFRMNVLVST
jgi:hypothetical protein